MARACPRASHRQPELPWGLVNVDDTRDEPVDANGSTEPIPAEPAARGLAWLRIGRALLPVVLAAGAVGIHFAINVPSTETIERLKVRAEENRVKKREKKKPKPSKTKWTPRSSEELKAERKQYFGTPFDKEPILSDWARKTQTLIGRAVTVARQHAFEGAPEPARVTVGTTRCRTVRCRFVVRSPYRHELDLLVDALHLLQTDGEELFRTIEVKAVPADEHGGTSEDSALRVTVMLTADEIDSSTIVIPSEDGDETSPEDPGTEKTP